MGHKHNQHRKKKVGSHKHHHDAPAKNPTAAQRCIELVLKCDSEGSREAIISSIENIKVPGLVLSVISSGVGEISKSDLFMAGTAARLIIGYEVGVNRALAEEINKSGVEIRLYKVIYRLVEDLENIGASLVAGGEEELVLGRAKVIALFKSCRKGIILGCKVLAGRIALGDRFRVIGAMGPKFSSKVASLHIEQNAVDSAGKGREVGLKIAGFNKAAVGDYVECVKLPSATSPGWSPTPGVVRIE